MDIVVDIAIASTMALQLLAATFAFRVGAGSGDAPARVAVGMALVLGALSTALGRQPGSIDPLYPWEIVLCAAGAAAVAAGLLRAQLPAEVGPRRRGLADLSAEELHRTTRRLEAVFRELPDALLLCTAEGVILDSNLAAEAVTRVPREQILGTPLANLIAILDDRPDRVARSFAERVSGELAGTREYRVSTAEGRTLWLEVNSTPIPTPGGAQVLVSARDIAERKAAEGRIRRERARQTLLVDALPAMVWTTDANLRVTSVRGRGFESLGLRREDVEGRTLAEIYAKLGLELPQHSLHQRALAGEPVPLTWRVQGLVFEGALAGIPGEGGDLVEVVGIALDVTDRERARQEADQKEKTLYAILDQAPAVVFIKDLEGRHLWVNRLWEERSLRSRREVVGKTDFELYPRPAAEVYVENDRQVLARGEPMSFVEKLAGRRRVRSYVTTKFVLRDERGVAYGLCGIATDETDRIAMEDELRHRGSLLDDAQAMAKLASWEWDLKTGRHYWAPYFYEIFGIDPETRALERDFVASIIEEDRARLLAAAQAAIHEGAPYSVEYRVRHGDGAVRRVHAQGRVERDANGEAIRFLGFAQDVTESRASAEKVRLANADLEAKVRERTGQLERALAELDSFSFTVSHDLRTPLRSISGYLSLMLDDGEPLDEVSRGYLDLVGAAVRRMSGIIADLLALSRVSHVRLSRVEIDLTARARAAASEIEAREPARGVCWNIEEGMGVVADRVLVDLLLANLLGNAFKFTRGRSMAHIHVGTEGSDTGTVFFVRDDGTGFDPDFAGHLFEPFRRLHDATEFEGNGIGLATVARIVKHHGGTVRAEGRPGSGATVFFTLPAAPPGEADEHE